MSESGLYALRSELLNDLDATPGVVAVEPMPETGDAVLFLRRNGGVVVESRPLEPYLFLSSADLLEGFSEEIRIDPLEGSGHYRHLAVFQDSRQLTRARAHMGQRLGGASIKDDSSLERAGAVMGIKNPTSAFLARSGISLFRDMEFRQLRRLWFDIEMYTSRMPDGERRYFTNPERAEDPIITICMADSDGWETCLSAQNRSEAELLAEFVRLVQERDPDVIEVFNAEFDFGALVAKATRHRVPLELGRVWNGSRPKLARRPRSRFRGDFDPARDGEEYFIFGRHVVDVYLALFKFDQRLHVLETHGLKDAVDYFRLNMERRRALLHGDAIADEWDRNPDRVVEYCRDDVHDTAALADLLLPLDFDWTGLIPASLQRILRLGMPTVVNLLLLRKYLQERRSVPRSRRVRSGARSDGSVVHPGLYSHVVRLDIAPLYPGLMREEGIAPETDELRAYERLLHLTLEQHARCQEAAADHWDEPRNAVHGCEAAWRELGNAYYHYLYATGMPFNDPPAAQQAAETVSAALQDMVRTCGELPIEPPLHPIDVNPDEILVAPAAPLSEEQEQVLIDWIQQRLPPRLRVFRGGHWRGIFLRSPTDYASLDYDGTLCTSGSFRNRRWRPLLESLVRRALLLLLQGQPEGIWEAVEETRQRVRRREVSLDEIAVSEQCRETAEEYRELTSRSGYPRQAVHELMLRSGGRFTRGDTIRYFIAGSGTQRPLYEMAEFAYNWDPARLNVDHLLARIGAVLREILEGAIPPDILDERLAHLDDGQMTLGI